MTGHPEPRYSAEGVTCAECMANVHHHVEVGGKTWCEHHVPTPTDDLYTAATTHPIVRQTALAEGADTGDRWGTIMGIGFTICDALAVRGEYVPAELQYVPAGLPDRDDLDTLDAEEAEAKYPDHGDLYFAWGLGLGEGVGSIDADDLRDYLTGPWQAAYDALTAAGEDY